MDLETLGRLTASVQATPGVAFAAPPLSNQRADAAVVFVVPDTAPQAVETEELIEPLRNDVVPTVLHGSGLEAIDGGVTAIYNYRPEQRRVGQACVSTCRSRWSTSN